MSPELGPYAGAVLGAYAVTLILLGLLVGQSLRRAARVKRALALIEAETRRTTDGAD